MALDFSSFNDPFNSPVKSGSGKSDIIKKIYKDVLGRDPDSDALMYYISQPVIDENAIIKQMIESSEHADILKAARSIDMYKEEQKKLDQKILTFSATITEKDEMIKDLNHLIDCISKELADFKRSQPGGADKSAETSQQVSQNDTHTSLDFSKENKNFIGKVLSLIFKK